MFASPHGKGKQPYWPSSLYRVYLKPALEAIGITEPVGWHTLRHSFGTLMKANGEDVKTIQELLRHANFKVTMDVYTQAVTKVKRSAHSRVARQIMGPIEGKKKRRKGMNKFGFSLSNPFKPSGFDSISSKLFILLASPTGFEPVLSP